MHLDSPPGVSLDQRMHAYCGIARRQPRVIACCGMALGLVLLGVAWRTWIAHGLLTPLRVTESSMVPHLYGEHVLVRCTDCQRQFAIELFDPAANDLRNVCQRCGSQHAISGPVALRRGERVLINKWSRRHLDNLRWNAVAVRNPRDSDDWLVKRLVGLPGETVQVKHGDVYVDGVVQAKSLDVFRQMAIPIYDTVGLTPSTQLPVWSRWRISPDSTDWRMVDGGYEARPLDKRHWSWLSFTGCDVVGRRPLEYLVLDDYSFNHSLSRRLHPVTDVLLVCQLRELRQGRFACRARIQGQILQLTWDVERRRIDCEFQGRRLARRHLPTVYAAPRTRMELAICDGRVHFALNESTVLSAALPPRPAGRAMGLQRLELGVRDARMRLSGVELYRDVYYLPRAPEFDSNDAFTMVLGPGELCVLGDNSPVSEDSRHFGPVRQSDLLGSVVVWPRRIDSPDTDGER